MRPNLSTTLISLPAGMLFLVSTFFGMASLAYLLCWNAMLDYSNATATLEHTTLSHEHLYCY